MGGRSADHGSTWSLRVCFAIGVAVVVLGACGGDGRSSPVTVAGSATSTDPTTTQPTDGGTPSSTSTAVVEGAWEVSTAELVTTGIATQSDDPVDSVDIDAVGSTSTGVVVAGSVNGGFAVWRSDDLESFEPVYSEICCDRYLRASSIAEFDGSLLIGGTGEFGVERTERSFLLRSDDDGATWALTDDPLFMADANRVDHVIVTDDTVLVDAIDDRRRGTPRSVAAWSDDLTTWRPIELPGRRPDDWPWFVYGTGSVFAISQRSTVPDGGLDGWAIWRSDDGGRRFGEATTLPGGTLGTFLAVGDTLVAVPDVYQGEFDEPDLQGLRVLDPDGSWRQLEPDVGTWGDGSVRVRPAVTNQSSGRTYTLVTRTARANTHYCYEDVDTCQRHQSALLATDDGITWQDVAEFPIEESERGDPLLVTGGPAGEIVVLAASYEQPLIHVTRWVGTTLPPLVDTPDYPAPDIPVPLYDRDKPFSVGDVARYPLGLGGCGGMYIDNQMWDPETPLPDPVPDDWPHRPVEIADGPTGYLYGTIERVAPDTIEFSIDGQGTIATFHPAPPPEYSCG